MCKDDQNPADHQEEFVLMAKEYILIWGLFQSNILVMKKALLPFPLVRIKMC